MPRRFLVARRPAGAPSTYVAVRNPLDNPRSLVARGREELARGLAVDVRLPGETGELESALRAFVLNDTRETEAALCAVLAAKGVPDPAAWIERMRDKPRPW